MRRYSSRHADVVIQAEAQTAFAAKHHVLLAGYKRGRGAGRRSNTAADERSFAARGEGSDQGAAAGATTDEGPVALLMRAASCHDARGCERNVLLADGDAVQRQPKFTRMVQSSRVACYDNMPGSRSSQRHDYPILHYDWFINHSIKALTRRRRCAREPLLQTDSDRRSCRYYQLRRCLLGSSGRVIGRDIRGRRSCGVRSAAVRRNAIAGGLSCGALIVRTRGCRTLFRLLAAAPQ